jgi:hypothetical protein
MAIASPSAPMWAHLLRYPASLFERFENRQRVHPEFRDGEHAVGAGTLPRGIPMREFSNVDGRRWRVWAVQPDTVLGERRERERRERERRVAGAERALGAPGTPRRSVSDRRVAPGGRPSAANLLPGRWRGGWLVFEALPTIGEHASPWDVEVRRLVPIPPCWDTCSETALQGYFAQASTRLLRPNDAG